MQLKPHVLLVVAAIGLAIFFTQKNNDTPQEESSSEANKEKVTDSIDDKKSFTISPLIASIKAINFPDKELERCVFDEIKQGADSDNIQNISNLTKLQCNAFKITSLEGIEKMTGLKEVTIIGSDIQDATPLSKLNALTNIYLYGGNNNIQNIDSLTQLTKLRKVSFPDLMQTYCYEAKAVLKSMKENIDGNISSNLNLRHCRGKKNYKVVSALGKQSNGELLTSDESQALDDYEANLSWSGEDD